MVDTKIKPTQPNFGHVVCSWIPSSVRLWMINSILLHNIANLGYHFYQEDVFLATVSLRKSKRSDVGVGKGQRFRIFPSFFSRLFFLHCSPQWYDNDHSSLEDGKKDDCSKGNLKLGARVRLYHDLGQIWWKSQPLLYVVKKLVSSSHLPMLEDST